MSLKQRAMQCSGYIPPSQYVPVYSRPHRTDNSRLHEEISPITPKPALDDPYNTRTRTIHEAVKAWLESSPNSVISPMYRSRSPSSGSPRSHASSFGPAQVIPSASSASSFDRANSSPVDLESYGGYGGTTAVSSAFQPHEIKSRAGAAEYDRNDSPSASDNLKSSDREISVEVEDAWAQAEEATITFDQWKRTERELPILDLKSSRRKILRASSEGVNSDCTPYAAASGEVTSQPAAGADSSEADNSTLPTKKAGEDHTSEAHETPQQLPRVRDMIAMYEGEPKAPNKKVTFDLPTCTTTESGRSLEYQDDIQAIDERRFIEGANVMSFEDFSGATPVLERGGSAGMKNSDESTAAVGPTKRSKVATQTLTNGFRTEITESAVSTGKGQSNSTKYPVVVLNGLAAVSGGYELRSVSGRSNTAPSAPSAPSAKPAASQQAYGDLDRMSGPVEKQSSPGRSVIEQSKMEKMQARVAAWENCKNAIFLNRYKERESKIHAWEEQKIAEASAALDKTEMELQKKRAKATEKMQNDVAKAHKKAAEMKAAAESKRAEKTAKAAVQAQFLRALGKSPLSCLCVL